jgi:hypothetical protein
MASALRLPTSKAIGNYLLDSIGRAALSNFELHLKNPDKKLNTYSDTCSNLGLSNGTTLGPI